MALFGIGQRSVTTTIATAAWEIRAVATNKPRLFELGFSQNTAPAAVTTYGFGRPSSAGVNPTVTTALVPDSDASAQASLTSVATAWGTAPGVPSNFNRRISCTTASLGTGVIWTFPRGFDIGAGSSLVLWLITAGVLLDMWAKVDE